MTWWRDSSEYLISLREKGYGDESFYNEFDFICHCVYEFKESNPIQTKIFPQEKLNYHS